MINYIFHQQDLFMAYENRDPEYIYLGNEEMRKLISDTDIFKYVSTKNKEGDDMVFNGMEVFEVHKENHFNMC